MSGKKGGDKAEKAKLLNAKAKAFDAMHAVALAKNVRNLDGSSAFTPETAAKTFEDTLNEAIATQMQNNKLRGIVKTLSALL